MTDNQITETTILRDGTKLTRTRKEGEEWGKWVFSDGFHCFTDKRATALSWHRRWVKTVKTIEI